MSLYPSVCGGGGLGGSGDRRETVGMTNKSCDVSATAEFYQQNEVQSQMRKISTRSEMCKYPALLK